MRTPRNKPTPKPPRTSLIPGTILMQGQAVVDAKGIVRTFPKNKTRRERVVRGIQRKINLKTAPPPKKIVLPRLLGLKKLLTILNKMGFEKKGTHQGGVHIHKSYGRVVLNLDRETRSRGVTIYNDKRLQRILRDFISNGGTL